MSTHHSLSIVDDLLRTLTDHGDAAYFGEPVSQREHALQSAWLARREGAGPALVAAALLHDIGHLRHGLSESIADEGIDARHEEAGHDWLSRHFGPEVTEPIRLHVDAKRYLCAADPAYLASLSPASQQSLALQGGPFSRADAHAFADRPFAADAIRLRHWDDRAKVPGLDVPGVDAYRDLLVRLVRPESAAGISAPAALDRDDDDDAHDRAQSHGDVHDREHEHGHDRPERDAS